MRKLEREISLSRSSMLFLMKSGRSVTFSSIFVVVGFYVIGIYPYLHHTKYSMDKHREMKNVEVSWLISLGMGSKYFTPYAAPVKGAQTFPPCI